MKRLSFKATITDSGKGKPVLRLYIPKEKAYEMCLERGKQPECMFNTIIVTK